MTWASISELSPEAKKLVDLLEDILEEIDDRMVDKRVPLEEVIDGIHGLDAYRAGLESRIDGLNKSF